MALRLDNVGIVVEDLEPAIEFFRELGLELEGRGRVMFAVDDIDDTLDRLVEHGAHLVSRDVVQYEASYRLCYVRGPEGILIGLAQELR